MSTSPLLKKEIEAQEKASQPPNHAPGPATADSVPEIESPMMLSPVIKKKKDASGSSHTGARTFVKGESSETTSLFHDFIVESLEESAKTMVDEGWRRLGESVVFYQGKPVGTLQAMDQVGNQASVRDFVPAGLAFLMKKPAEPGVVKNFLLKTLHLQGQEKKIDNFTVGEGVLPASFKVSSDSCGGKKAFVADFSGSAIGRVAPVDSRLSLRAYTTCTGYHTLQKRPELQKPMSLSLSDDFDTFPTLICGDDCSMIDMKMGLSNDLIGEMPLKIAYPALEGYQRKTSTGSDNAATLSRKRKREDEDPKSAKQQIKLFLNPTRPVDVFWCDGRGTITFLGHIQNVPFMRNVLELEIQVNIVAYSHQHYNEEQRLYYRRWTTEGIVEISVDEQWLEFRRAVRGVILFEAP
uniref:neutral/alkaline invertase 3, chloroplastic-like n=1 Tax=Fragaria vesca subsp. vesca TaxID=101020 RepID=UPI0005C918FC|nr:PREDICTED: neutral/alkaline invertase 3, chloroplastic-like [Fragaria vesca subsp. vesca]XP_011469835.1 PREDICTED: neutral/alkaline invertase 3, chloroplastic-like [Fragaria vesca subsp. vesca]